MQSRVGWENKFGFEVTDAEGIWLIFRYAILVEPAVTPGRVKKGQRYMIEIISSFTQTIQIGGSYWTHIINDFK